MYDFGRSPDRWPCLVPYHAPVPGWVVVRPLVWCGPVFEPTGYADELRGMVMALDAAGVPVCLRAGSRESRGFRETLPSNQLASLDRCLSRPAAAAFAQLQHGPLDAFATAHDSASYSIGRSMFETDGLPSHWVSAANKLDELWVTSAFNRDTFRDAGVRVPMPVVPGGVDSDFFRADVAPLRLEGLRGTVFLSVFEWRLRKGWDVLLRAWAEAFRPDDDVTLVLRTYPISKVDADRNTDVIDARIDAFLRESCEGRMRGDVAPIKVLGARVAGRDLPALYNMASAFVLPTRGEGWGRPFMESMACGVPVIATNWSAHLEFMNHENSYLVDIDGLEPADSSEVSVYAGQRWATPSAAHLTTQLRRVHRDRAEARAVGERARRDMVHEWPWCRVADVIATRMRVVDDRLGGIQRVATLPVVDSPGVIVHGGHVDPSRPTSNAVSWIDAADEINEEPRDANMRRPPIAWHPAARTGRPAYGTTEYEAWRRMDVSIAQCAVHITVLEGDSTLAAPTPPAEGCWIVDVGTAITTTVPPHLVTTLRDQADRVVVPHEAARKRCLEVGVDSARVVIVPPAVDITRFTPTGAVYRHAVDAGTRFLVLGGDRVHRELPQVVAVYDRTFTRTDDVVLHIVLPPGSLESSAWCARLIADIDHGRRHPRLPRIWIDAQPLDTDELPALYRASDVLVHVGLATSRGLTVRQALACGIPVITTDGEPADTLIDERCGWRVPMNTSGRPDAARLQASFRAATDTTDRVSRGVCARQRAESWPAPAVQRVASRAIVDEARVRAPRRIVGDPTALDIVPIVVTDRRRVLLLAHADWHNGTAAAVVRTYASLFDANDDITLALCLDPAQGLDVDEASRLIHDAVEAAGRGEAVMPDLLLMPNALDGMVLQQLRATADVVVAVRNPAGAASARRALYEVIDSLNPHHWQSVLTPRLAAPRAA